MKTNILNKISIKYTSCKNFVDNVKIEYVREIFWLNKFTITNKFIHIS